jgi:hypothetical protein
MRIDDAGCLADLARDQCQLLFGDSEDVNRDVERVIGAELGGHSPRHDVQVLEALENECECGGVSICHNLKS